MEDVRRKLLFLDSRLLILDEDDTDSVAILMLKHFQKQLTEEDLKQLEKIYKKHSNGRK